MQKLFEQNNRYLPLLLMLIIVPDTVLIIVIVFKMCDTVAPLLLLIIKISIFCKYNSLHNYLILSFCQNHNSGTIAVWFRS
jgi:hypothetical protein